MNTPTPPQADHSASRYLRDVIYGAMDGAVTTFAVVSGVTGAGLSPKIVLILGVAGVVGDGFSMAAGNYLGTKAEGERLASTNDEVASDSAHPMRAALATFLAFLVAGCVPLVPYVASALGATIESPALVSTVLTCTTFFLIGAGKSLVVPVRWWTAGIESLVIGSIAAALAYFCGEFLGHLAR